MMTRLLNCLLFALVASSTFASEPVSLPARLSTSVAAPPAPCWVFGVRRRLVEGQDWSKGVPAFVDAFGKEMRVACELVRPFSEGLAAFQADDRWGFIDTTGAVAIEPTFQDVGSFSEGLAWVDPPGRGQDGGIFGYIDRTGQMVIPPLYRDAQDFHCGLAAAATALRGPFGYIKRSGAWAVPPRFSWAGEFSEGLATVQLAWGDRKVGCIDDGGTMVIPPQFQQIGSFAEGLAAVRAENGLWGFVNSLGHMVVKPVYADVYSFSCGLAAVRPEGSKTYGYIDHDGTMRIPPKFSRAHPFAEGFACVATAETRAYGYITESGEWLVPPRFRRGWPFTGGLAAVEVPVSGFSDAVAFRMGIIDTTGKFIWTSKDIFGFRTNQKVGK